ncbi:MAG: transposase [Chloroflexi bacterium]|nr:transposase [Chloroflexota bacterium]
MAVRGRRAGRLLAEGGGLGHGGTARGGAGGGRGEHGRAASPTQTGTIHHSDHGAQYTALAFSRRLEEAGLVGSMGTVGDALDNAVAESFDASLQTECLDRRRWRTRREPKAAIFDYVEIFYNRQRRHSALDYLTPEEFERRWRARDHEPHTLSGHTAAL